MGNGTFDFGKLARNVDIGGASGAIIDNSGNLIITFKSYVARVDAAGIISVVAGNGGEGFSGDGSLASTATLDNPDGMAIDAIGNIYVADYGNNRIRKIDPSGIITTVAGGGSLLGDGGPAISANLSQPTSVAIDAAGNIYISDKGHNRLRKINTSGIISTIAGTGTTIPRGDYISLDASGNLIYGIGSRIVRLTPTGTFTYIAGTATAGYSGDGGLATLAQLNGAKSVAIDAAGNMYIADATNVRIRKINTAGIISTIAGNGIAKYGFAGDGGPATLSLIGGGVGSSILILNYLGIVTPGVATDRAGNLFIADCNTNRIRKVSTAGIITTVAGNGIAGFTGDGGPATAAELQQPLGVSFDGAGNLYIADYGNHHIRKMDTFGIITTIAGGGSGGLGDGGPATAAVLSTYGVFADSIGNVYIADADSQRIRKVTAATGIITTVVGNGTVGYAGDGGPATAGKLNQPMGVTIDRGGNMYIADFLNSCIRKVDTAGILSTVVGSPSAMGYYHEVGLGDGGPGVLAKCYLPWAVTTDKYNNLYFSDRGTWVSTVYDSFNSAYHRVRRVDRFGYVTTVAGNGTSGYSGDGYTATTGEFQHPFGICIDTAGQLYVGDNTNYCIRKVCCLGNPTDHPPVFANGYLQNLSVCYGSAAVPINSLLTMTDADAGDVIRWKVSASPAHGTLSGFIYTSVSAGIPITPTGLSYAPAAGFTGLDSFTVYITDGVDSTPTKVLVTVNPLPVAGTVSGATAVCVSDSIILASTIPGGTWMATNPHATVNAAGTVIGVSAGTDTVIYAVTTFCGTAYATYVIHVNALSAVSAITGPASVCAGASITLSDSVAGGVWSTADPYIAVGTSSGVISGIAPGTAVVSYAITNSCGIATMSFSVTVYPAPFAGTITGAATMCVGNTDTLANLVAGGVWSTGTPTVATVSTSGVVTGIAAGAAVIFYTVTNGCGSATAFSIVNVTAAAPISYITGPSVVCEGATISLGDAQPGGTWSSSDSTIATVNSTGVVSGVAAGVVTVSYSASLGCGLSVATTAITVHSAPSAGVVSGTASLCVGGTGLLTSTQSGGVWSSSNSNATISAAGVITGAASGIDTFTYMFANSCGAAYTTFVTTVYATATADTIAGSTVLCVGASATLSDATPAGIWSSSNTAVVAVNASGVITAISSGTAVVSYTVSNGCGTATALKTITVNAATAGAITGITTLCPGSATTLYDGVASGVWSVSTPSVVTINTSGVVTAISSGSSIISYTVAGACGVSAATIVFNVGSSPSIMPITGISTICAGTITTLHDVTPGGAWTSGSPSVATINSSGMVTALSAGTTIISYQITAGCGTATVTTTLTVEGALSAGVISGAATLCSGAAITLTESATGGVWSSSNPAIGTVSSGGVVTGGAAGTVTVSYTIANTCGSFSASHSITVGSAAAGTITGITTLCPGSTSTLSATPAGGSWSISTPTVATINSAGLVTALASGSAVVTYTITGSCGTGMATAIITVGALPVVPPVMGTSTLCVGAATTLSVATTGGVWSSSNTSVAVVNASGVVTVVAAGTATISYMVTAGCGTAGSTMVVHVESTPYAGSIAGTSSLCEGTTGSLSASVAGGVWSSSNMAVATVSSTGIVTGINVGDFHIVYTVTNSCGSATALFADTVITAPSPGIITGSLNICDGATTSLACSASGGIWSSSSVTVATVNGSGLVTGLISGMSVISYTTTNSCGAASATAVVTVNPLPYIGAISGVPLVAVGGVTTLNDAVLGGIWSTSDAAIASIDAGGVVHGFALGTAIITYTLTNSFGCSADTTITVIVSNAAGIANARVNAGYKLYPNPAVNEINIGWQTQSETPALVVVTDVAGREVIRQLQTPPPFGAAQSLALDLRTLSEGTYTLTIISQEGVHYSKLFTLR